MTATAPLINSIDLTLALATTLIVMMGFWRGIGREILQLIVFIVSVIISFMVFSEHIRIEHVNDVIPTLKFIGWFSFSMYIATFLVTRIVNRKLFRGEAPSQTSRIAGGVFGFFKVSSIVLALNFTYAIYNPNADRQAKLPKIVTTSYILTYSDAITEKMYRTLAAHGILSYKKILYRKKTAEEIREEKFEETFGVKRMKKPW